MKRIVELLDEIGDRASGVAGRDGEEPDRRRGGEDDAHGFVKADQSDAVAEDLQLGQQFGVDFLELGVGARGLVVEGVHFINGGAQFLFRRSSEMNGRRSLCLAGGMGFDTFLDGLHRR